VDSTERGKLNDENARLNARLSSLEYDKERERLRAENHHLRRMMSQAGMVPESEVELAKDLFTPEINGGKYSQYIAKNLGLGNYDPWEAKVMLIYQSLIDTAVNEKLEGEPTNLAGFFEAKKMAFASIATASKGGFLLQNLRTSRGISEITSQDLTANKQGIASKLRPNQPQMQQGY
jgi:hypothetical protein